MPCVYRIAGGAATGLQGAMAATLWAGNGSLVSHGAAAVLWGFAGARARKVELWVPARCSKTSDHVIVHRGTRLDRADRAVLDGIPITSPTRTLIDYAARLEDEALLAVMEDAFRRDLTHPERLAARLFALRTSGRVGGGRLEALLDARPSDAKALESRLEAKFWRLIDKSSLPRPERQFSVVANGRRYRLDFAWPELRVAVECDGWSHHGGREKFEADQLRRSDLASLGWYVIPVTWEQCTRASQAVLARIERRVRCAG